MRKNLVIIFAFLGFAQIVYGQSIEAIQSFYDKPVTLLSLFKEKQIMHDHDSLVQIFTHFNTSSYALLKKIRADIKTVEKHIKEHKEHALHVFRDQLKDLMSYVKKHRVNNDALLFHINVKSKYQKLFDMVANEQDVIEFIHANRSCFDLKCEDKRYLDNFLQGLRQVAARVSEFEDDLHSDYIDLKLMNYVFKIELIRLRNAILFDKRYKNKIGC